MTTLEVWAEWFRLGLAFAIAVWAYFGPLRWARIAAWRQDLFEIRNALWDKMRELGTLDTRAHHKVRGLINTAIRAAPVMNLGSIVWVLWKAPPAPPKPAESKLSSLLLEVEDPRAVAAIRAAMEAMTSLIIRQLFYRGFPGILVGLPFTVFEYLSRVFEGVRRFTDRCRSWMSQAAERFGETAASAAAG